MALYHDEAQNNRAQINVDIRLKGNEKIQEGLCDRVFFLRSQCYWGLQSRYWPAAVASRLVQEQAQNGMKRVGTKAYGVTEEVVAGCSATCVRRGDYESKPCSY